MQSSHLNLFEVHLLASKEVDVKQFLKHRGLFGIDTSWIALVDSLIDYSDTPFALEAAAETVRELYDGDISRFLKEGGTILDEIYALCDQQIRLLCRCEGNSIFYTRQSINLREDRTYVKGDIW